MPFPAPTLSVSFLLVWFSAAANAQVPPFKEPLEQSLEFTADERNSHSSRIFEIVKQAATCIKTVRDKEIHFRKKYGVSLYFGQDSDYYRLGSLQERAAYLRESGRLTRMAKSIGAEELGKKISDNATSCVGFAMTCLKQGFESQGQGEYWDRIERFARANDIDGTAIQEGLRRLGWKTAYWNADTNRNSEWDAIDEKEESDQSARGFHKERYKQVLKSSSYWQNAIDDSKTFVNFKKKMPDLLKKVPLVLATAHSGYHVFLVYYSDVFEASAGASPADDVVSWSKFGPLDNGAPDGYYSGVFAIPPGKWD